MDPSPGMPTSVIAAPMGLEHDAVIDLLPGHEFREQSVNGTLFQITEVAGEHGTWRLVVTMTGRQNEMTAAAIERTVATFAPRTLILVGVAGGRRTSEVGDVIAATEVYGYEIGLESDDGYFPRASTLRSAHALVQQAHQVSREGTWLGRLRLGAGDRIPNVHLRPLAAGSKVVASNSSPIAKLIDRHCGDAQGIEMEGFGALAAAWMNQSVEAMVIRGVSDLLADKTKAKDRTDQPRAARNAAAFALAVLDRLESSRAPRPGTETSQQKNDHSSGVQTMPKRNSDDTHGNISGGIHIAGNVNTTAMGPHARGFAVAVGEHARGVMYSGVDADQRRLEQALELIADLREALEEERDAVGDLHEEIAESVDEIEDDIENREPDAQVHGKLQLLEGLVKPFTALADLVAKIIAFFGGGES
ncbi:5'-methylthioadenosine/S-adenosylhomocysteine nucleosidase family protein [Glycomyces arizonensis]|uniref:5'-methylthioadenosine/S-adenosylhomocysteine nucleosidase family protein n=1 Tax=Glycomyces arizonensis TaxID=256035 RepID=UPI0003F6BBF1|nr:hypothetical protein [Glycomyces arizonensis]